MTLQKSFSGLGFSFLISELGPEEESIVQIKSLSTGHPAGDCGLLKEGDIILAVNGEPVRGLSYEVNKVLFIFSIPKSNSPNKKLFDLKFLICIKIYCKLIFLDMLNLIKISQRF